MAIMINENSEGIVAAFSYQRSFRRGGFFANLVAADVGKANRLEDSDAVNNPANLRLPVNSLKDATGGGRGDHIVGDTFDLHFGAGEESVVTEDFEDYGGFHS